MYRDASGPTWRELEIGKQERRKALRCSEEERRRRADDFMGYVFYGFLLLFLILLTAFSYFMHAEPWL